MSVPPLEKPQLSRRFNCGCIGVCECHKEKRVKIQVEMTVTDFNEMRKALSDVAVNQERLSSGLAPATSINRAVIALSLAKEVRKA